MTQIATAVTQGLISQTVEIGPAVFRMVTPDRTSWVRHHYDEFEVSIERSTGPDLAIFAPVPLRGIAAGDRIRAAHGEVLLNTDRGSPTVVRGTLALTPRAAARATRWFRRRGAFAQSRRLLLLRHVFEHAVMTVLDLRYRCFSLHSATAARGDQAVLILGTNGAGKTSAALELARDYGYRLVADNFTPCDGKNVYGFPGAPRVKEMPTPKDVPRPAPLRAEVSHVLMLNSDGEVGPLPRREALARLRRYIASEREDHRDSPAFGALAAALRADAESCDEHVVESLAERNVVAYDWRCAPLADVLEGGAD